MSFTPNHRSALVGLGLVVAMGAAPVALVAGDVSSSHGPLILAQDAEQFDDAMIEAFAAAQASVEEVRAEYAAQYQAAVRDAPDITVEEYNAIIDAANRDPGLAERINEAISETQL